MQDWSERSRVLNNTLYMQFPQQQNRNNTVDNRVCNRCGMQGHIRRQCQLQVAYCTFCNATSHTTGVCRARAAFVRDNPVSSSRRTSPNGVGDESAPNGVQQQNVNHTSQWSAEPTSSRIQSTAGEAQSMGVYTQPSGGPRSQSNDNDRGRLSDERREETHETTARNPITGQPLQTPAQNPEILSYQPQYQDN